MATLYRADGTKDVVKPANGKKFTLEEMQTLVGGYIEFAPCVDMKQVLVVDEDGKVKGKKLNMKASLVFKNFPYDCIVGDALVADLSETR